MHSKRNFFSPRQALLAGCCAWPLLAHAQIAPDVPTPALTTGGTLYVLLTSQAQGLSAEHMAISLRRRHLTAQAQLECAALDSQLPIFKRQARRAPAERRQQAQERLQQALARFAHLRC